MRLALCLVVVSLLACTPGYSVKTISQTSAAIVLEFTYSVGGEYQATIQEAEKRCQQYGKHARLNGQPAALGIDRAVATFDCVTG